MIVAFLLDTKFFALHLDAWFIALRPDAWIIVLCTPSLHLLWHCWRCFWPYLHICAHLRGHRLPRVHFNCFQHLEYHFLTELWYLASRKLPYFPVALRHLRQQTRSVMSNVSCCSPFDGAVKFPRVPFSSLDYGIPLPRDYLNFALV